MNRYWTPISNEIYNYELKYCQNFNILNCPSLKYFQSPNNFNNLSIINTGINNLYILVNTKKNNIAFYINKFKNYKMQK